LPKNRVQNATQCVIRATSFDASLMISRPCAASFSQHRTVC
jgi:hypothetical protein